MSNCTIGERIKSHRTRLAMTQDQLARRLGVSPQAVSKWEHDQSCPDISILPELATVLGTSIDALLGRGAAVETKPQTTESTKVVTVSDWTKDSFGRRGSILFALYILGIGALMVVNRIFQVDLSWWTLAWTLGLVFVGVHGLMDHFSLFSLSLSLAGAYVLLSKYELFTFTFEWSYVLPVLFLLWGISLLVDILFKKKSFISVNYTSKDGEKVPNVCQCNDGWFECELSLGERRAVVATEELKGGRIDTGFGSFSVDFSACTALAPNCVVEVENSFGSLTLLVPKYFKVVCLNADSGLTAATAVEGTPDPETRGTLTLHLDNTFGSVVIRYIES